MQTHSTLGSCASHSPQFIFGHTTPWSIKQALTEFVALQKNETLSLVPLLPHRKPIGCKWSFSMEL